MLEARHLTVTYGSHRALEDVNAHESYTNLFIDECKSGDLSVRQVKVLATCAQQPPPETPTEAECEPFLTCLDGVQKGEE